MASNPRPPQLELSLGHPGFKRSFQQFGLDVDDGDDIDGSSSSSSNSSSSSAPSSSASGLGATGTGSSSRTSTSSQAGHSGHNGHAANKRARSEGPETSNHPPTNAASLSQSQGSSSSSSSALSYTTAVSTLGDDDEEEYRRPASSPHSEPLDVLETTNTFLTSLRRPNHQMTNTNASIEAPPSLDALPFSFEPPPTPSIADFAAARSSRTGSGLSVHDARSTANSQPHIPGFSGMRSPRSSSPAPPPLLDVDVSMRESIEEDEDLRPFTLSQTRLEIEAPPSRSSQAYPYERTLSESERRGLSQLARQGRPPERQETLREAMNSSADRLRDAADQLRSVMARTQAFEHILEPMRMESELERTATGSLRSTSAARRGRTQAEAQPRLPPFEFEIPRAFANNTSTASGSGSDRTSSALFSNLSSRNPTEGSYAVRLPNTSSRIQTLTVNAPPRPAVSASVPAREDYPRFEPASNTTTNTALSLHRESFTDLSASRMSRVRDSHPTPAWLQNRRHQSFSSLLRGEDELPSSEGVARRPDSMFSTAWMDEYVGSTINSNNTRARGNADTGGSDANHAGDQDRVPSPTFSSLISARLRDLERTSDQAAWTINNISSSARSNNEGAERPAVTASTSGAARPERRNADLWDMHRRVDQLFRRVGDVRRDTDSLQEQTTRIRRRAEDIRRRTESRTRRLNDDIPNILDPEYVPTPSSESSYLSATRPDGTVNNGPVAVMDHLPHLFSADGRMREERSETVPDTQNRPRPSSSAGVLSTRELDVLQNRQDRSHIMPPSSAGSMLQPPSSIVEPQPSSSFVGTERDRPRAASSSSEAINAELLNRDSTRTRYAFLDDLGEESPAREPGFSSGTTGPRREYEGFFRGLMPFNDRLRATQPSRPSILIPPMSSAARPPVLGGDAMSDVFELRRVRQQREASLQRRRTHSPTPPTAQTSWRAPTLDLDLSFEPNFYPSFAASTASMSIPVSAPAPTQEQQRPARRETPNSIFIPPPPSASDTDNTMQLPSLNSSAFEPLANSLSLGDLVNGDEASRTRPAPTPAIAQSSVSEFMPRNYRARNDQASDITNRFSWLQPERNDVSVSMDVERQIPETRMNVETARPSRNGGVWSLMDDEEILSPRDGLFSSSSTLHSISSNENINGEQPRRLARIGTEGLFRSLAEFSNFRQQNRELEREHQRIESREREMQAVRQVLNSGNTRMARLRQLHDSYHRNVIESRDAHSNVGVGNSSGQRRPLSAVDSLTGGYPSWMQDAADWESNLEHLDRASGNPRTSEESGSLSTSTEAAAFFASGPAIDTQRRPSPNQLRQRRLHLSGLGDLSLPQVSDTMGPLAMESPRHSPPATDGRSASSGLELVLYPSRDSQSIEREMRAQQQGYVSVSNIEDLNDSFLEERRRVQNELSFAPSAARSRQGPTQLNQQQPTVNAHTQSQVSSRPPVLPPIGALTDTETLATLRSFADEFIAVGERRPTSPAPAHEAMHGLVRSQRHDPEPHDTVLSTMANAALSPDSTTGQQRGGDLAMHRALMLRSVQNISTASQRADEVLRNATAITTRAGGSIQHTLEILDADGPPLGRRQLFQQARERDRVERERERLHERVEHEHERVHERIERERFRAQEREREQERRVLMRPEPHVRWGEVHDDPEHGRPPAYRPIRTRTRRNSLSAIFAPPPPDSSSPASLTSRTGGSAAGSGTGSSLHNGRESERHMQDHDEAIPARWARNARRSFSQMIREQRDETLSRSFSRRARLRAGLDSFGDFVRDEDFDASYESLIALAASLGEVKPRATPTEVLEALPNGLYKDWQTPGCDTRCPICLDDYNDVDTLLKAEPCNHWCHKDCFEQWLHTANTCPVCRSKITSQRATASSRSSQPVAGPSGSRRSIPSRGTSFMDRINVSVAASRSGASTSASTNMPTSTSTTTTASPSTASTIASRLRMETLSLRLARRISPFGNTSFYTSTSDEASNSASSAGSSSSAVSLSGVVEGEREGTEERRNTNGDDSGSDSDELDDTIYFSQLWRFSGAPSERNRPSQHHPWSRGNRNEDEHEEQN